MLDSEWPKGLHLRGLVLLNLKRYRESKKEFNRLLKIKPDHAAAKKNIKEINNKLFNIPNEDGEAKSKKSQNSEKETEVKKEGSTEETDKQSSPKESDKNGKDVSTPGSAEKEGEHKKDNVENSKTTTSPTTPHNTNEKISQ
eukprot:UN23983